MTTYIITSDCITCRTCQSECPEDAIYEGDEIYVIDQELCQHCGICIEYCPAEAIQAIEEPVGIIA